jgi:hypothetical protein
MVLKQMYIAQVIECLLVRPYAKYEGGFGMRRTKVLICLLTLSLNKEIIRTTTCGLT